jgi:hypothetical protein
MKACHRFRKRDQHKRINRAIPEADDRAEFGKLIADETEKWRNVVEFAGVSVDQTVLCHIFGVMPGHDPGIHPSAQEAFSMRKMDCRVIGERKRRRPSDGCARQ